MKRTILVITVLLLTQLSFSQSSDPWVRFYDTTSDQSGYKDLKGTIKIPLRFEGYARADTFHHIMAVLEKADSLYKRYYLLKNGRKVAQDSVYSFEFTPDCESEGKILFKDWKKDRVGMLDKNGVVIIPAIYNELSPFRNGLALAYRNAKRMCWDRKEDTTTCEHLGWEGGELVLINEKNEILADSVKFGQGSINWYSLKLNDPCVDTSIYTTITGRNNTTYSFIDYDKEFKQWFYNTFLPAIKTGDKNLSHFLFDEVAVGSASVEAVNLKQPGLMKRFPTILTSNRFETNHLKRMEIREEHYPYAIDENALFRKYLTSCGEHHSARYPLFEVTITQYKKRPAATGNTGADFYLDHDPEYREYFEFLRTENGYKLVTVSLNQ